ncbi:MAG: hypothetical protein MZU95_07615 [Desulfomicrobium escambiense]|nr:hypothetical protein [Desulfomicrobium escambiense]
MRRASRLKALVDARMEELIPAQPDHPGAPGPAQLHADPGGNRQEGPGRSQPDLSRGKNLPDRDPVGRPIAAAGP